MHVATALGARGRTTHSGFVDSIDGALGVRGWAVNLADPLDPVRVLLYVGDQLVAETLAEGEREDISAKLGCRARSAYAFDAAVMQSLSEGLDDPQGVISVRVAATGQVLPGAEPAPTITDIRAQLRADRAPAPPGGAQGWLPSHNPGQGFATETAIDRVLLVPGLGCLVEGWVMSPVKRVEGLRLRVGASVLSTGPESLHWKPRPDLRALFPGSDRMIERAGFVGLFTGDAEPEDFADPMLKVIFQGGQSANWSIPPNVCRHLGHSASVEDALRFFPSLQEEVFFARFAEAAVRAERGSMQAPVKVSVARGKRAMVFVLPEDRCDLFLLFEDLAQQCRAGGGIDALTFIAAGNGHRADAMWLVREFQTLHAAPRNIACSLLVIEDGAQAFALLPDILSEIGAQRFFFAGPGVFLNGAGWARARQALAPGEAELVFFGIDTASFQPADTPDGISARCFAWSTGPFTRWSASAPAYMGGYYRDNGLSQAKAARVAHLHAARSTRAPHTTRIRDAVNAAVYESVGQQAGPSLGPPALRPPSAAVPLPRAIPPRGRYGPAALMSGAQA
jgi:hypothetical protein